MKKLLIYLAIVSMYFGCGGSDEEDAVSMTDPNGQEQGQDPNLPPENGNTRNIVPTVPRLIEPKNLTSCTVNNQSFEFSSTDANGDEIEYYIEIARDDQFTEIYRTDATLENIRTYDLEAGEAYYWRVRAYDGTTSSDFSETFSFYTEGQGERNFIPFINNVEPVNNAILPGNTTTVRLTWSGNDIEDERSMLRYNVYFGVDNGEAPPIISFRHSPQFINVIVDLTDGKDYVWYVDVEDSQGGINQGVLRKFRLED